MASLERRLEITNRLLRSQQRASVSSVIGDKAEIFASHLIQTISKSKIISIEELKEQKTISTDNPTDLLSVEAFAKKEKYNPNGVLDKQDRINRVMHRVRRGRSGCRCNGDEKSSGCRSRSCRNKDKEVKPINMKASGNQGKGSQRISVRLNTSSTESQKAA